MRTKKFWQRARDRRDRAIARALAESRGVSLELSETGSGACFVLPLGVG